jgi:hypothetical protein
MVKIMESNIKRIFFHNFPQKFFSVVAACVIWVFVSYSIITTEEFTNVQIRIVNLPQGKTMRGLMPNGILDRRVTLHLTGKKSLLSHLKESDLEVVIDVAGKPDEWIEKLDKKNLVSLNPDVDLFHNIESVTHEDMIMKLSPLVTEKIPIYFHTIKGEPPEGYQFLDVFPQRLTHTLTGPEEDVRKLQEEGLEIVFDLSQIPKDQLDGLQSEDTIHGDEVSFIVPDAWKVISIPFFGGIKQEINGPEAKYLRLDFLRKELMFLDRDIPIWVFYPLESINQVNPLIAPLATNKWLIETQGVTVIRKPLYVSEVSRLFLDVVRDRLEIVIIADPKSVGRPLRWEVQVIDPQALEEKYVSHLLLTGKGFDQVPVSPMTQAAISSQKVRLKERERYLRDRFHAYLKKFRLYDAENEPFHFHAFLKPNQIVIQENDAESQSSQRPSTSGVKK